MSSLPLSIGFLAPLIRFVGPLVLLAVVLYVLYKLFR